MNVSAFPSILLLFISLNGLADTKKRGRLLSGNALLPRCEPYTGTVCAKYIKNVSIYVKPSQPQIPLEGKIKIFFNLLPSYLSDKCKLYAYHALCLIAFPPCDQTVNYTKPRQFCQEECKVLEQHLCVSEFGAGPQSIAGYVPSCSKLPPVGSDEHKKCLRLNVKVDEPVFRMKLKNVTADVGEMVALKCKIKSSNIAPRITWYKDGKIIQPGHPFYKIHLFRLSSRMKIRRVRMRDSGKFMCKISNVFWNVSSENWITVVPSTKPSTLSTAAPTTKPNTTTTSNCGFLKPSSVCWKHLKNLKVYFHDPQNQHESTRRFQKEMENLQGSSMCSEYATAAMCYHLFPVCAKSHMKHRLCKKDCLMVKNKICQKQIPSIFPHCSKLPKNVGRKGRHCNKLTVPTVDPSRCGQYIGNNICGKYLPNKAVYLHDMKQKYNTEKIVAMSLKNNFASKECLKFGIPGMCYHLFPACERGIRKSRLCKEDCIKLKTEVCITEVSLIKQVSVQTLEKMFPECSSLPSSDSSNGSYCTKLGIDEPIVEIPNKDLLYDSNHKCYNKTGLKYRGVHNISVFGKPCINWRIPSQSDSEWSHNFCRNPEGKLKGTSPWCYVNSEGRKEYCNIPKCGAVVDDEESTSLGRTIYVVIAIAAVLLLFFVTMIVYWKVHDSKRNLGSSPQGSAAPFAKCSSIQLIDGKESTEIKSFIMNEKMKRGKVKYTSVIGEGSFCKVFKGALVDDEGNSNMNIVIKGLSEDATVTEKDAFHRETSLLCPLQHVNILGLLGVSPCEDSVFVVFEYLSETNLHQFLKLKSPQNICDEDEILAADELFDIALQIANGMKYLAEFNYIHGDLAARNCFISENELNVKISMLGIGSHKYPSDYGWLHKGNSLFPIRWMSPESLESLVLTSENDVWAFGVLLWEIFSLGLKPYHQYSNTEVTDKVRALELLECSQHWPRSVTSVMRNCWAIVPAMRPCFETIHDTLSNRYISSIDRPVEVTV